MFGIVLTLELSACVSSPFLSFPDRRPEPSEVDRAILSLKTQKRKLGEYQRQVQGKVVAATEHAHKCVQEKNRSKAIFHLKQKKVLEVRLGEIEQYLINVEETVSNSEGRGPLAGLRRDSHLASIPFISSYSPTFLCCVVLCCVVLFLVV